jgi:tRNA1(Val) A37 N6-methylase TrmN6
MADEVSEDADEVDRDADEVSEDTLLGGRVRLRQPRQGYRAAIDPVLLAACVDARPGQRVLDLGTGAGAAALCLMARVEGLSVIGLEIDPATAALARQNAALNAQPGFTVRTGDVAALPSDLRGFDHVIANPPYLDAGSGGPSPVAGRARSNVDPLGLEEWVAAAAAAAPRGGVAFIQRADRLDALLAAFRSCLIGALVVAPLWPHAGEAAKRVLVRGRVGRRTPLRLHPGLVLHEAGGEFTPAADAILRGGGFCL